MPPIIRIQRRQLSEALSACHPFFPEKPLKKSSETLLNKVSSALWPASVAVAEAKSEMPYWVENVSSLIEAGIPDSFLSAEDIFQLFVLLKELGEEAYPPEETFYSHLVPLYEVLPELSFWDFISALDDAWVFRFQRKPSTNSFVNINSSPDITPPPEEETCGKERFIQLISLDTEIIQRIVISGHVLLQSGYKNHCPSGKLGLLIDKLIAQSIQPQDDLKEYPCSEPTVSASTINLSPDAVSAEPLTAQKMNSLPFSFLSNSKVTPIKNTAYFPLSFISVIGFMAATPSSSKDVEMNRYFNLFSHGTKAASTSSDDVVSDHNKDTSAMSSPSCK